MTKKTLYAFVVTSLNKEGYGGAKQRQEMVEILGRDDVKVNEKVFIKQQDDAKTDEKLRAKFNAINVKTHICLLMEKTKYQHVYVHSKLSIYDNAFLLLGSANWNLRSMTQDTELDIAVQCHDNIAKNFREELWNSHLFKFDNWNPNKSTDPADWFELWDNCLKENFAQYQQNKPLNMNLFPYFEDITELAKFRTLNPFEKVKQTHD
jgi:phosphatidylserine/phosphatidylglycerophosphate/cardiolipin synthase-like enzyme